jgi:hypothetical protein
VARSKVFGPEAPPKKPAPKRVPHGPEKPPKRAPPPRVMHGPEKPPLPKGVAGPPEAPLRASEPPPFDYGQKMQTLREEAGGTPWKLDEAQEYETVKTLRGPMALAGMGFQKATEAYMEPAIQEETKRVLERYGGWTGGAALATGFGTLINPAMAPAAVATGGANAASYIAEGLLDARAGRARIGAEKVALGLVDAILPETNPNAAWLKGWRGAKSAAAYPLAAEVLVNTAQDKLRAYADETGNKQLSQELKALAADPERLKQTIQKK